MAAVSLQLDYTAHNLPATINELVLGTPTGIVTFTYDNRWRLIHEVRTGTSAYNLAYEYDQGGNRTKKIDALASREWVYQYDVGDYATYGSDNNRLQFYPEFDTSGVGSVLVAKTWSPYGKVWSRYAAGGQTDAAHTKNRRLDTRIEAAVWVSVFPMPSIAANRIRVHR